MNIQPTRLNGQRCWDPLVAFPVLAARDKLLLQTQSLEFVRDEMEAVGDEDIFVIASHFLAKEVFDTLMELILKVGKLRVEFVILLPFGFSGIHS